MPITKCFLALLLFSVIACPQAAWAQESEGSSLPFTVWFGVMELPFLFITVLFAFFTAQALRGGVFGSGMRLIAWGFLVMGIGHLHMQVERFTGINLFGEILGDGGGKVVWIIALVITWTLSGLGFYAIYRTSKHG